VGLAARTNARLYERRRPEQTALYEVVRDNLETLYGAIDDGALDIKLPKHAKKELEAYLDCGWLCRGFGRLRCGSCSESRLVASRHFRSRFPKVTDGRIWMQLARRQDGGLRTTRAGWQRTR
jgi:hypothetical protein